MRLFNTVSLDGLVSLFAKTEKLSWILHVIAKDWWLNEQSSGAMENSPITFPIDRSERNDAWSPDKSCRGEGTARPKIDVASDRRGVAARRVASRRVACGQGRPVPPPVFHSLRLCALVSLYSHHDTPSPPRARTLPLILRLSRSQKKRKRSARG